jgi:hypothetical protein
MSIFEHVTLVAQASSPAGCGGVSPPVYSLAAGGVACSLQIHADMRLALALPATKIPASSCYLNLFPPPNGAAATTGMAPRWPGVFVESPDKKNVKSLAVQAV